MAPVEYLGKANRDQIRLVLDNPLEAKMRLPEIDELQVIKVLEELEVNGSVLIKFKTNGIYTGHVRIEAMTYLSEVARRFSRQLDYSWENSSLTLVIVVL